MLLVCSTTTQYAEQVARAALLAGLDYMDIYAAQKIIPILNSLEPDIQETGRCFITQAGFHPGLLAPFIRYAASYFSQYQKALVAMVMNDRREVSLEATTEIAEMIVASATETYVFKDGRWRLPGADYARKVDFGAEFGVRVCYPVWFEEMRALPEQYGLEEAGAYIAGFSSLDNLMLRLVELLNKLKKETGTRFLAWLLCKLSPMARPPFGVRFKLEAAGTRDGKARSVEMLAQHDDPYVLTAICTVACLLQYLDGSIRKPGLWLMGHLVEPGRLLKDVERMGAKVQCH
jgi:saccharopine dehydrogenase (NAD+, L-lysine-forming)